MNREERFLCPHCGQCLSRWSNPQQSTWSGPFQLVCFNDDCPYFVRGWNWMMTRYNVAASYRYRFDPASGDAGPLPVWSREALRERVVQEEGVLP